MNPFHPAKSTRGTAGFPGVSPDAGGRCGFSRERKGQALLELVVVVMLVAVMVMGLAEYGRIFVFRQMMVVASREGANMAARGTTLSNTVSSIVATAPAMLFTNGYGTVIASTVTRSSSGTPTVSGQVKFGSTNFTSRIGALSATGSGVTLPSSQLPQTNQTLYITEVFYPFSTVTPIGNLLTWFTSTNSGFTTLLYDVTYF
jgi:Flp pilus assembly protein TadG